MKRLIHDELHDRKRPLVNDHRCALVDHHATVKHAASLLRRWLQDDRGLADGIDLVEQTKQCEADLRLALKQCTTSHNKTRRSKR